MIVFKLTVRLHEVAVNEHLDRLARSSDPFLQKRLEKELRPIIRSAGNAFTYSLTDKELTQFTQKYGEQFVADPSSDLNQYFDVINRRFFSRSVPTQLAVLYLFGTGHQYRPNVGAVSGAGEGIAGYCVERFGYQPLVRPLGVMPDAVAWTNRNGVPLLALVEAKGSWSTKETPEHMLEQNVAQFFVDVKTRATGFQFRYEAYLVCSLFKDGHEIECGILHVDLGYYCKASHATHPQPGVSGGVPSYADPAERLRSIIRLQAETATARDEYLTEVLSEEATRSATLALLKEGQAADTPAAVEKYISDAAERLGLAQAWKSGQDLVKETKGKEEDIVKQAIQKYRRPDIDVES